MEKKGYIFFIAIGIMVFILIGGIYIFNKQNQRSEINEPREKQQEQVKENPKQVITLKTNQEGKEKSDEEYIKKQFQATEIVSNNLPESIEFWTEAYCPGSGNDYDYLFNDNAFNYSLYSCEKGEIGSHGGCKTCIMSKIKLIKALSNYESSFKKNIKFTNNSGIYVEKFGGENKKEDCEVKVWKDGIMKIIFPSYYIASEMGNNIFCGPCGWDKEDKNYDGYSDLVISGCSEGTSDGSEYTYVYLYNQNKRNIDWESQIVIWQGRTPSYEINEGAEPQLYSECSMRTYKNKKVFKEDLPCPDSMLKDAKNLK